MLACGNHTCLSSPDFPRTTSNVLHACLMRTFSNVSIRDDINLQVIALMAFLFKGKSVLNDISLGQAVSPEPNASCSTAPSMAAKNTACSKFKDLRGSTVQWVHLGDGPDEERPQLLEVNTQLHYSPEQLLPNVSESAARVHTRVWI